MRILYLNNCWFTNVGEAFIDIGGMELVRQIFPEHSLACFSAMSNYYVKAVEQFERIRIKDRLKQNKKSSAIAVGRVDSYLDADWVILPGMLATKEFLQASSKRMVDELKERGCKLIFIGLGGLEYNSEEVYAFSKYLEKIRPELIVTRDKNTFENYKNVAECISGLDCAFWTVDTFDPRGFQNSNYDIVAFNRTKEPIEFSKWKRPVIRPWHMQYSYRRENYCKNILISDTPYDYLTAYANANRVYTDLVHATIISLMYGKSVKYWYFDKRSYAFDALDGIVTDSKGFLSVDEKKLTDQKEKIQQQIKRIINFT